MPNSITHRAHGVMPIVPSHSSTIEGLDLAMTPQGQKAQNMLEQARQQTAPGSQVRSASTPSLFKDPSVALQALPGMDKQEDDATSRKNSGLLADLKKIGWYLLTGETGSGDESLRRELNSKIDELNQQVKTQQALIEQLSQWLAAQSSAMATTAAPPPQPATRSAPASSTMPASPAGPAMDPYQREHVKRCNQILNGKQAMKKMQLSSDQLVTDDGEGRFTVKKGADLWEQQKKNYETLSETDKRHLKEAYDDLRSATYLRQHGPVYHDERGYLSNSPEAHMNINIALKSNLEPLLGKDSQPATRQQATQTETRAEPLPTKVTAV
ncbi:hypothetical protein THUN1379_13580 [Paludibacterium sp. THUN1379]|uniref:hypothetical protein n=1 Tax=Paludibacterium sp. THUN1379 TaxID=3112107 RepID=UPI00308E167B|nr:hypothetical protein THUN1379_13580 [Paludibacterium sp. THUN1379]